MNGALRTMRLKVFVSADSAVGSGGFGDPLFRRFGGAECDELVSRRTQGALDALSCRRGQAGAAGAVPRAQLHAYLDGLTVDPGLPALAQWCKERSIDMVIAGTGPASAIRSVLTGRGMEDLPVMAAGDRLEAAPGERVRIIPDASDTNAECPRCLPCLRNHLLQRSADDECIVWVGEKEEEICPARHADIVFARGPLQTACRRENVTYHLYRSCDDVRSVLEGVQPRKCTAAEHLRRAAFLAE